MEPATLCLPVYVYDYVNCAFAKSLALTIILLRMGGTRTPLNLLGDIGEDELTWKMLAKSLRLKI